MEIDSWLNSVIYEYRRRVETDEVSPFGFLFRIELRFAMEQQEVKPGDQELANA